MQQNWNLKDNLQNLFLIFSVVSARKNSMEEEMDLFKPVNSSSELYKTEELQEEVLDKPTIPAIKHNDTQSLQNNSDEEININFSSMKKIDDSEKTAIERDSNDLNSFLKLMAKQKFKEKRQKVLSDEHIDRESVSSSSSFEDEAEVDIKTEGECGTPYYTISSRTFILLILLLAKPIRLTTTKTHY